MKPNSAPLSGIRVVDFTHVISGPFTTQILADLGADVVKVEGLDGGDIGRAMGPSQGGMSHYFAAFNRNKRSVVLNLKSEAGSRIARELVQGADVVVENFAPGVIERLGLGYDAVKAANPAVVYCSVSGFGQSGPLAQKRSLDLVAQAYAGIMSTNGTADGPPLKVGVPIGDTCASLFATIAILSALYQRKESGAGRFIDVAMFDSLLTLLGNHGSYHHFTGTQPERVGSGHYFSVPYGTYDAADGQVVVAVFTDASWAGLCNALGVSELAQDERFRTPGGRSENREALHATICPLLRELPSARLIEKLEQHNVPCAPVHDISGAVQEKHTRARNMLLDLAHPAYGAITATSLPIAAVMRESHTPPPLHGEHTAEVLRELGRSQAEIDALLEEMKTP